MELGIIGLARSGKSTVFRALTWGRAEAAASARPQVGVVKVPDPRLEDLARIFKPQKVVPAEVRYTDMGPTPAGLGQGQGFSGPLLPLLGKADALIHVVRAFEAASVPHPLETVDPDRDVAILDMELAFADLIILERRLERLEASLKGARAPEREAVLREQGVLHKIKASLEAETPLRAQPLTPEEARALENFQFLSAKPLLLLFNLGEGQVEQAGALKQAWRDRYRRPGGEVAVILGKLEEELAQMTPQEAGEFRTALGLPPQGWEEVVRLSYLLLGLVTFYTVVHEEVRAWTVAQGTPVPRAAGKVHSDMERGFIRAEVIGHRDLVACGSLAEARHRGLLRVEGKAYQVQDGDVVTILFHV